MIWCHSFILLMHAFTSLTVNCCCLESKITGAGESTVTLVSAPYGVLGCAAGLHLTCGFRRSCRSSRLPTSLGCYRSLLPHRATSWTQAILKGLMLSLIATYILKWIGSLQSTPLDLIMHCLWCLLIVKGTSIETPNLFVASLLSHVEPSPSLIFAVSFSWRCLLLPHLCVNSAAAVFAVSNRSAEGLAHSIRFAAHFSSCLMSWLELVPASATTVVSVRNTRLFRTALTALTEPRTLWRRIRRCPSPRQWVALHSISKMYFSHCKPPGVSERMWSVNLDVSISGEYRTLGGLSCRPSK